MVLFFIAELALTFAFKLSTWCLSKTCDGITYLVTYKTTNPSPGSGIESDDDCEVITITRQEYAALKQRSSL